MADYAGLGRPQQAPATGALNPQHLLRYDPATDETEIVLGTVLA